MGEGRAEQASETALRTAQCLCGQLSISVSGEPALVVACNCLSCQRRTGGPFSLSSRWDRAAVAAVSGRHAEFTRVGSSGRAVTQHFCPVCGGTVFSDIALTPDKVAIPVGCFADPTFPAPGFAVWCESQHPWVSYPETTTRMARQPGLKG